MPGKAQPYDQTYLTPMKAYRIGITENDANAQEDANGDEIPAIRLDVDASKLAYSADGTIQKYETSARAYNGQLEIYIHVGGANPSALISIYAWGAPDDGSLPGAWCLLDDQTVTENTLIISRDIPNTAYVVTVTQLAAGTTVSLIEQHTT